MMLVDPRRRAALGLALLAPWVGQALAQTDSTPLRLGIAPHASVRVILQMYQPLRLHLERELGRPVEIATASGFDDFGRQAAAQKFDLVMSTGPLSRYLQVDAGYRPLVKYFAPFKALVLVAAGSRFRSAADLANGRVIMLGATSSNGIWGQSWLHSQEVVGVDIKHVAAADSIAQLVLAGDGDAGLMSNANLLGLDPAVRGRLRILAESPPLLGRVYMLSARLATQQARYEAAFLSFAGTEDGRAHLAKYELGGLRRVERGEMEALDPLVNVIRRQLMETHDPRADVVRRDLAPRTQP